MLPAQRSNQVFDRLALAYIGSWLVPSGIGYLLDFSETVLSPYVKLRKISGRGIETTHDNMVTPTLSHHSLSDVVEKVVGFLLRGLGVGVSSMAIERTAATWILAVSHCEGGHSRGPSSNCSYRGTKSLRGGAGAPWATFHW